MQGNHMRCKLEAQPLLKPLGMETDCHLLALGVTSPAGLNFHQLFLQGRIWDYLLSKSQTLPCSPSLPNARS